MIGPPHTDPVYLPHKGEPGPAAPRPPAIDTAPPSPATMRELGHGPMEGLHVYFLVRMQLKHCTELIKAMDDPSQAQDVKHMAAVLSRAAQRFAATAQEFAMLNGER